MSRRGSASFKPASDGNIGKPHAAPDLSKGIDSAASQAVVSLKTQKASSTCSSALIHRLKVGITRLSGQVPPAIRQKLAKGVMREVSPFLGLDVAGAALLCTVMEGMLGRNLKPVRRFINALLGEKVEDEGVGIASDDLEKIFSEFEQISNPLSDRDGGTGLGLAIVSRIMELLDGKVNVESTLGQGSCFTLSFPLPASATP